MTGSELRWQIVDAIRPYIGSVEMTRESKMMPLEHIEKSELIRYDLIDVKLTLMIDSLEDLILNRKQPESQAQQEISDKEWIKGHKEWSANHSKEA